MYANVIWHRRSSMALPVARPIASFGCPKPAKELVQLRLVDLQWHRRPTYRDTNSPSHVAVRNRVSAGGAAVLYKPGHGLDSYGGRCRPQSWRPVSRPIMMMRVNSTRNCC
jgi:hypothetical protein